MAVKVKDSLTKEGANFKKTLEELNRLKVMIGLQQGQKNQDGTDLVDIALFNELGTENIPSRPFLRDSVDANADKINAFLKRAVKIILRGGTAEDVLKKIGVFQKGLIQKQIVDGDFVPNAPATIKRKLKKKRKGSVTPLVDNGDLRKSINFVIKEKGGE